MVGASIWFKPLRNWKTFAAIGLAILVFLPWPLTGMVTLSIKSPQFLLIPRFDLRTLREISYAFVGNSISSRILFSFLFLAGLISTWFHPKRLAVYVTLAASILCLFAVLWADHLIQYFFAVRQLIFLIPVFMIVCALGVESIAKFRVFNRWYLRSIWLAVILILAVVTQKDYIQFSRDHLRQDWRTAIHNVAKYSNPNDQIFVHPMWWGYCTNFYLPDSRKKDQLDGMYLGKLLTLTDEELKGTHLWWIHFHVYQQDPKIWENDPSIDQIQHYYGGITTGRCVKTIQTKQDLLKLLIQRLAFSTNVTWANPPQELHVPAKEKEHLNVITQILEGKIK